MDFLDSWIFDVALDSIFNKICTLIYNAYFLTTIHMSTRPEGFLDLDKILLFIQLNMFHHCQLGMNFSPDFPSQIKTQKHIQGNKPNKDRLVLLTC